MQSVVGNDPIKTLGETGFAIRPCRLSARPRRVVGPGVGAPPPPLFRSVRPCPCPLPSSASLPPSLPPPMLCPALACPALPACLSACLTARTANPPNHTSPCPSALGATGGLFPFARPGSWREGALEWGLMRGGCGHGAAGRELPGRKERGEEGSEGEGRKEGGWADGWMAGWMHGRMGGWMDGWIDGWREGGTEAGRQGLRVGRVGGAIAPPQRSKQLALLRCSTSCATPFSCLYVMSGWPEQKPETGRGSVICMVRWVPVGLQV